MDRAPALLSFIGLASQFAASVLLVGLYALLGREVRRRGYFRQWSLAWLVLAVTLGVLVLRFELLPILGAPVRSPALQKGMLVIYQAGKLLWCALLVSGTFRYVHRIRRSRRLTTFLLLLTAYAVVTALLSANLLQAMIWQSPVAAGAVGYCAFLMLTLPASRRTLGSRLTGWAFAANGALWAAWGTLFLMMLRHEGPRSPVLAAIASGNGFLDQIAGIALGYGMVVLLLEDAKREVDAAHAELSAAHHELRRAALFDPLTGTLNRRAFDEGVGLELARGTFGAVGMLDLDDLKAVNDGEGHAAGDALLRRLADAVRSGLRPSDKLYRWGGDEFLLIMPGASADDLTRRVAVLLAEAPAIQVSLGATEYEGAEGLARAIPIADRAMYEEKKRRKLPSTFLPPEAAAT